MYISRRSLLAGAAGVSILAACDQTGGAGTQLTTLLDRLSVDMLRESPEYATALAVSEEQAGGAYANRLSDASTDGVRRYRGILEQGLADLRAIDRSKLAPHDAVTVDVVATSFENDVADLTFEPNATTPYVVTQLNGSYQEIPDFLDSQHALTDRASADAYIERLRAFALVLDQETSRIGEDSAAGFTPPDFAIDRALTLLRPLAGATPADAVMVKSLARRLPETESIPEGDRVGLIASAEAIVRNEILPAYGRQIAALEAVRSRATSDAGIWRLPDGEARYAVALKNLTSTNLSADEIHQIGVELSAQLSSEMDVILRQEGLTRGSVAQRFQELARRPDQLYANTDAGRAQMLADINVLTDAMRARMPDYFGTLARAPMDVKRVPVEVQDAAPGGYYQPAALDGSRPAAYYINLRDTSEWPRIKVPSITYHEGMPGHHWQIAIQQESQGIPFIRSALLFFGAFIEGWGLYAEQLADEIGAYVDTPVNRLGYLQSAAFRASRLVVDTGMHAKRWTREQAIQSMNAATGDKLTYTTTEIERYCVWPGQATSYMVGRQAINRMRDNARAALGDRFDIKGFHDALLTNGSTPLSVTEQLVNEWVASKGAA